MLKFEPELNYFGGGSSPSNLTIVFIIATIVLASVTVYFARKKPK
jgi:hypothetical protein